MFETGPGSTRFLVLACGEPFGGTRYQDMWYAPEDSPNTWTLAPYPTGPVGPDSKMEMLKIGNHRVLVHISSRNGLGDCSIPYVYTNDNITGPWTLQSQVGPWIPRAGYNSVTIADSSQILVIGGYSCGVQATFFNDVYVGYYNINSLPYTSSKNMAIIWRTVTPAGAFPPRGYFGLANRNELIYIAGGTNMALSLYYNDVWISPDYGATWLEISASDSYTGQYSLGLSVIGAQLVLSPGCQYEAIGDFGQHPLNVTYIGF